MRIVVKIGTSTLAHPGGRMNIRHVEELVKVLSGINLATGGSVRIGGEDITNVYFCGFSDKEINSASLNFDNIEFGTLPEMKSVAFQNAKSSVWTSDCVFNLGALL